ncbi:Ribonuclease H-like domain containing protein [Trema orientale]|uniref:Ribonuclease H-like domain containing protein n=1 Tax=Trema orientale TaxID=63057 RepID=A0A2P5B0F9_TREOI|nr:Ribonuclease H-like domain containing protein [Trema orientale]
MDADAIIRDSQAASVRAKSKVILGYFDPLAAELLAICEGLLFAKGCGIRVSVVEYDCYNVVQSINFGVGLSSNDLVVWNVISYLSDGRSGPYSFVPREGNKVAHLLAKMSFNLSNDVVCYEEIPTCIAILVAKDISS